MAWYDTHQAAVDPDNPAANEQITFDEWNAMVTYLKDKIIDKAVNDAAIGNDKVLVYKTASSTFVFEAQSGGAGAINDLTDVTISGVPADNEVLAYDTGTSEFINQTAAEAGLATATGLAAYYPLTGATLTGNLNMGDYMIDDVDDIQAYDSSGIIFRTNGGAIGFRVSSTTNSFIAYDECSMNSNKLVNVNDPTAAQDASTKNYDDTHLLTKEAVTSFTDGYIPVYRTASGKFEMEEGGGTAGLPVVDTTNIVKGSADGTKLMRFEVDGLTTGTTRVMTVPDKNITLCDTAEVMLLSGSQVMAGAMDMGGQQINNIGPAIDRDGDVGALLVKGGQSNASQIWLYGKNNAVYPGALRFMVTNAAKDSLNEAIYIAGATDTPIVEIKYGLDMAAKDIDDIGALILNTATELTIATGVVTPTQSYHTIDTESDDATDDLTTISGGSPGQILVISAISNARTVVVKTSATIALSGSDFSMDNAQDTLTLICTMAGYWKELARANNGA